MHPNRGPKKVEQLYLLLSCFVSSSTSLRGIFRIRNAVDKDDLLHEFIDIFVPVSIRMSESGGPSIKRTVE